MKKLGLFTFYLLFFAAASYTIPYIIPFLQGLGFNGVQVGILAGMVPLVTLIGAPFWTGLADAKGRHRLIMGMTMLGAIFCTSAFPLLKAFLPIMLLAFLYATFSAPITAFADSATMSMLGGEKAKYGRIRLGGTIGYGLMAPLASLIIARYGIQWAFWGSSIIMILAFAVTRKFAHAGKVENTAQKWDIRPLLASRRWVLFLTLAFIAGVAFTSINNFLYPYMAELGIDRSIWGIALTIATIGELPMFFFANRLLKRFGAYGLLVLGMIVTGLRLLLYAGLTFPVGILVFQLLNGMAFPLIWVAGVSFADENAPEGMKATAQGLLGAMVYGFGASAGGLAGGVIQGSIGGKWMYLIFGCLVLLSVAAVLLFERAGRVRQPKSIV